MAIYDTEEEQLEALKKWWEQNNGAVITGVIGAIIVISGWNFWQTHQQNQAYNASAMYEVLLAHVNENKKEAIDSTAQNLIQQFGTTPYANYAALLLATSKVQNNDLEGAKAILQQQMQESRDSALRHVARLRLAQLLLATHEYEKALQLLAEVHPGKSEGFTGSYDELEGDLYVAMNRLDEARAAYQRVITAGRGSPLLQFKLDDITSPAVADKTGKPG